jgi:hypothetical protein
MDASPERGERAGANESIEAVAYARPKRLMRDKITRERPRRESNPHLRFRKPLFYPLNYGD